MSFRRAGTALLITLTLLGGCWWHDSAVPAIEADDRPRRSPIRDGVYCQLQADAEGLALEEDCVRLAWDRAERRVRASEAALDSVPGETVWIDLARLSDGLAVMQNTVQDDSGATSYELFAILPARRGYVTIPLPAPEVRDAIAAEEGVTVTPPPPESDDYGRIVAGDPAAVRAVVERSALSWLQTQNLGDDERLAPYDPEAEEGDVRPLYSVRVEALDEDVEEAEALDEAVDELRKALERAARR